MRIPALYALYIGLAIVGRALEDGFQMLGVMSSDPQAEASILTLVVVSLLTFAWTMFSSALSLTLFSRALYNVPKILTIARSVELIVIETIRAIAAALIRLPLLILPGLYEWVRLTPIPFLVLFDEDYRRGRKDALQAGRDYFAAHRTRVILLVLFSLVFSLSEFAVTTTPEDNLPVWSDPLSALPAILMFALARLAFDFIQLEVYRRTFPQLTSAHETGSNIP